MASNDCTCGCGHTNDGKPGPSPTPAVASYQRLRWQLDELGYHVVLPMEAVPLVSRLVADLLHTTSSLERYKEAAKSAEQQLDEERKKSCSRRIESSLEDSSSREAELRELSTRVHRLEADIADARFLAEQRQARIRALERESADKSRQLLRFQSAPATVKEAGRRSTLKVTPAALPPGPPAGTRSWAEAFGAPTTRTKDPVVVGDDFGVKKMAARLSEGTRTIAHLQEQVRQRDQEICRLTSMIAPSAGGAQHSIENLRASISTLEEANRELRSQLQDALRKQHEAMMRAVRLAERNQTLEAELKDVDGVAMSVEASCNTALKESSHHVKKLQDQLSKCQQRVMELEREVTEKRCNSQNLLLDIERLRLENEQLREERRLEKRKRSDDDISRMHQIESDLTAEIERLAAKTTFQKRRIVELEERLNQCKLGGLNSCGDQGTEQCSHPTTPPLVCFGASTEPPPRPSSPPTCTERTKQDVPSRRFLDETSEEDTQEKQSATTSSTTCKTTARSTVKHSSRTSSHKGINQGFDARSAPTSTAGAEIDHKIVEIDLVSDKEGGSASYKSRNPTAESSKSTNGRATHKHAASSSRVEKVSEFTEGVDTLKTARDLQRVTDRASILSRSNGQEDHVKSTKTYRKAKERSCDIQEKGTRNGHVDSSERKEEQPKTMESLKRDSSRGSGEDTDRVNKKKQPSDSDVCPIIKTLQSERNFFESEYLRLRERLLSSNSLKEAEELKEENIALERRLKELTVSAHSSCVSVERSDYFHGTCTCARHAVPDMLRNLR